MTAVDVAESVGDRRLLELPKVAFLCSRRVPASAVIKCYDWAIDQRDAGRCVVGGFHSAIEKDVLHYLLKGTQPVILALHRGIGPRIKRAFSTEVEAGRLLIISPFRLERRRGGGREAAIRNRLIISLAESVVVGHLDPGGSLEELIESCDRPVEVLSRSS